MHPRYYKHFPTLLPLYEKIADFYGRRDTLEKIIINVVGWGGAVYILFFTLFAAPAYFPTGAYIEVEEGASLKTIAEKFEDLGIVADASRFRTVTRLLGDETRIPAGYYYFSRKENMIWVAMRVLNGDFETTPVKVTVPEGATVVDIARLLVINVPEFDRREFMERAREGYLFPDTYFFRPGQSTEAILSVFENNFRSKMLRLQNEILKSGHTLDEIVIMASILEKEASKTADRKMIAGVLWHRIDIGMPLQVDAVFPYYLGRNTFEVTKADLRDDHPYNTYTNKGLPPGAIGNPGLDTILAAAQPTKSNYVYFLSDRNGNFHYSVTYEGHLANKRKYLD